MHGKLITRIIATVALVAAALLLGGCGASVSVYAYTENGTRYNAYTVTIDADTVQKMEETAASDADGARYNVPDYMFELFSGFNCELIDARMDAHAYTATYRKAMRAAEPTEKPAAFLAQSFPRDITMQIVYGLESTGNPFTRTYTRSSPNPFNGLRAAYDAIVEPNQSSTVLQQLKNGRITIDSITGERTVELPALPDAFPYLRSQDIDGLRLDYITVASSRMTASGASTPIDSDNSAYVFSRYFDNTTPTIDMTFTRPVPYGWYLTAILAGVATVAIFVLVTRTKKQKPTLLDRFPYNPEEYRDYENHLPMAK